MRAGQAAGRHDTVVTRHRRRHATAASSDFFCVPRRRRPRRARRPRPRRRRPRRRRPRSVEINHIISDLGTSNQSFLGYPIQSMGGRNQRLWSLG